MSKKRSAIVVLAFAALLAAPGCYTRVTKARGIGADYSHPERHQTSKPKIDQFIDDVTGQDR